MKILHVVPYFSPAWGYGGPPRAVYEVAKEQVRAGHDVQVLTTTAFDQNTTLPAGTVLIDGIRVTRLPNLSNWIMWKFHFCIPIGVQSFMKTGRFDVVHLHEVRTLLNYLVLQTTTAKVFLSPWGTLPYNDSMVTLKKIIDFFLLPKLQAKILTSFAQTEHEKECLKKFQIGEKQKIVPLGINEAAYQKLPARLAAQKFLTLSPTNFYYLFLGRFSPHKGLSVLVTAFAELQKEYPSTRLLLVGRDDGYLAEVVALIEKLSLTKVITIMPPLYDEKRFLAYRAADAFVFTPTVYEETGTVCLEALATGLSVLTTQQASIPFMTKRDGVIEVENTHANVTAAMRELYLHKTVVDRKKVFKKFSWKEITQGIIHLYEISIDAK